MKIKVCGLTVPNQVEQAAAAGADLIGLILKANSPRCIAQPQAALISARARSLGAETVGVFVDATGAEVHQATEALDLSVVQLHGGEPREQIADLAAAGIRVWKVLTVKPGFDPKTAIAWWDAGAEAIVLDAWHPKLKGGTGQTVDWSLAAQTARLGRVVLAGGLSGSNVADAVRQVRPWAVDASSRLESAPGIKEPVSVISYIDAAREAAKGAH